MIEIIIGMENDSIGRVSIKGSFTNEQVDTLRSFIQASDKLIGCKLVQEGALEPEGIEINSGEGIKIKTKQYTEESLFACLHLARPLILHREPWSYNVVSSLLGKAFCNSAEMKAELKGLRRLYENGQLSSYFDILIDDKSVFERSRFESWLNSVQYHKDDTKSAAYNELVSSFKVDGSEQIMLSLLNGKILAVERIKNLCEVILKAVTNHDKGVDKGVRTHSL